MAKFIAFSNNKIDLPVLNENVKIIGGSPYSNCIANNERYSYVAHASDKCPNPPAPVYTGKVTKVTDASNGLYCAVFVEATP